MATGVLCDSWGFCCVCICLQAWSNTYSILSQNFICCLIIFLMNGLLYMTVYRNCRVTSYYFVVLLKQTTEVSLSHNFTTVALPCLRRSVTTDAGVQARILPFDIHEATKLTLCMVFSRYFPFPCQYSYTNATYLHCDQHQRYIISGFCSVFN